MIRFAGRRSVFIGMVILLVGMAVLVGSVHIDPVIQDEAGARIFPFMASVLLVLSGSALILVEFNKTENEAISCRQYLRVHYRIMLSFLIAVLYLIELYAFGYIVATTITTPMVFTLFGIRNRFHLLLVSVLCPSLYYLLFFEAFDTLPINGEYFDITALLRLLG